MNLCQFLQQQQQQHVYKSGCFTIPIFFIWILRSPNCPLVFKAHKQCVAGPPYHPTWASIERWTFRFCNKNMRRQVLLSLTISAWNELNWFGLLLKQNKNKNKNELQKREKANRKKQIEKEKAHREWMWHKHTNNYVLFAAKPLKQ